MHRFKANCSLKFVKMANRAELKFEKAYTLAISKNNAKFLNNFPDNTVKTVYVTTRQIDAYKEYND